ncbi:MAG: MOSC domain-containing protein, partial [Bacteroidota bacterium]
MAHPKELSLAQLMNLMPQVGQVTWIGIRPEKRGQMEEVQEVKVSLEEGLMGDHYRGSREKKRQVTLIQEEHIATISSILGMASLSPTLLRRNIVVKGINLLALKNKSFQIGEVILEMTGACHPCTRMEEDLGPGGYNAVRGHGGITARVRQGGSIRLGDSVR